MCEGNFVEVVAIIWFVFCFCLQDIFKSLTHELIGDDTAPSYFDMDAAGNIFVREGVDLPRDTETTYIVSVHHRVLVYTTPTNTGLMLGQRRKRWFNIEPSLFKRAF